MFTKETESLDKVEANKSPDKIYRAKEYKMKEFKPLLRSKDYKLPDKHFV